MKKSFAVVLLLSLVLVLAATGCMRNDGMNAKQYRARSSDHRMNNDRLNNDGYTNRSITNRALTGTDGRSNGTRPLTDMNRSTSRAPSTLDGIGNGPGNGVRNPNDNVSGKLLKHISSVKGVDKATVVINNRDAIVGVDVKASENSAAVAQRVRNAVKKAEPGYTVHVTADKNLHTRLQGMQRQMKPLDGHPIRNMTKDIGTLIRDIGRAVTAPLR
ncbi:hypothetical protein PAECIP111893_02955 [Paenibacillus plantiphilus]|uniref:Sporulation lipoprotein, YhcN/YlaJ family n=1 Tax=Paenibacillus plantiphilus TaxID=2905650 RepID=A0ABN8GJA4_9BACL|nr:YhcN/YlaJ family sporulation lipoprotein [Paenibacillus plantiphilus]CAH1209001.1 hypothetical protein PAECIP111893_02955 [Paenibacillus plantiphilus]